MTLTQEQLNSYIVGSLNYSAVASTTADLDRSLQIYRSVLANGYYHLPFFIIHDFLMVLFKGYDIKFQNEAKLLSDNSISKLITRYERECLARLLQSQEINAAVEITQTSKHPLATTERLLLQLLKHFAKHYPKLHLLNPSLLRDYQIPTNRELSENEGEDFSQTLEAFLNNINDHINWSELLFQEDFFELAHLDKLNSDHLRVGCRQILEVSRILQNTEPITLDLSSHEDEADTAFVDETHYPTGGFSGLTNRGNYENLLTSELVYMDEGIDGVSLFDLRYSEGELLFYLRDSGNLRRKRRSIHFVLDVSRIFESKLPGYQWQYSVLLQGFCLRLLHDLFEIFEIDALRFHFHYIKSEQSDLSEQEFFEGEIGMMQTILADYIKHGWVSFETVDSIDLEQLTDSKRKSYSIILADSYSLNNWNNKCELISSQEIPLHASLISVDSPPDEVEYISIPRSGLSNKQLNLTKQAVLEQLVS